MTEVYIDDPIELPNGKLVCRRHREVHCFICCVDYSFMYEDDEDEAEFSDEDEVEFSDDNDLDADIPYQMPDGRLVCYRHRRMVCEDCGDNYSFTARPGWEFRSDDGRDDDGVEDITAQQHKRTTLSASIREGPRRAAGWHFPSKFRPPVPDVIPVHLFSGLKSINSKGDIRFTLAENQNETATIIYTDGACLNNGQANPRAGWGFWYGMTADEHHLVCHGRLEKKGPFGDDALQTSNRAELRAVIAALRFRDWSLEGFKLVVIGTDSVYVVEGSTKWAKTWMEKNWRTKYGPVKNKDLWEALLGEIEQYKNYGIEVMLWRIPRDWNMIADGVAKEAAAMEDQSDEFKDIEMDMTEMV
ncbi:hypothetical protein Sste5346_008498 [Sporothrix stenoceras]|uniref:ribonuclease H n=1 Tax=Sporothrix stenoceras TaxID=5173 RepID=A0ABR3YQA8_9PEZI